MTVKPDIPAPEKKAQTDFTGQAQEKEPIPAKQKKKSWGVRLFDWGVYGGISGVAVFIASIFTGYWAKYGRGANLFKQSAKVMEKTGMSGETAEHALMTTALMMGGNLAVWPIKELEDRKPEIVAAINKGLDQPDDTEAVKAGPKQTWTSLILSRVFLAWTPVFLSFRAASALLGSQRFAYFEDKFAEHVICRPFGKPTHVGGQETKAFRYGKIAALDVFASTAASILLYVGTRIFGEKGKSGAEPADKSQKPTQSIAGVTPPLTLVPAEPETASGKDDPVVHQMTERISEDTSEKRSPQGKYSKKACETRHCPPGKLAAAQSRGTLKPTAPATDSQRFKESSSETQIRI